MEIISQYDNQHNYVSIIDDKIYLSICSNMSLDFCSNSNFKLKWGNCRLEAAHLKLFIYMNNELAKELDLFDLSILSLTAFLKEVKKKLTIIAVKQSPTNSASPIMKYVNPIYGSYVMPQSLNKSLSIKLFYATWCGFSKIFLPIWNSATDTHKNKITFTAIECDKNLAQFSNYNITCFPTVIYFYGDEEVDRTTGNLPLNDFNAKILDFYASQHVPF